LKINGKRVILRAYRKEEIFEGPFLDRAPDLVLLPNKGFNLRAKIDAERGWERGSFTGKHTQEDAFILLTNSLFKDAIPEAPVVSDIVTIMERIKRW
jgi:predicted AlkP superfamily phosphohydrolase/phosphomutase